MSDPVIAVLAFDRISPFHLSVPCVIFGEVHPGLPRFDFRVCSWEAGPLRTTAGFSLSAPYGLDSVAEADMVIVPSWRDVAESPPPAVLAVLRDAQARGAQLGWACVWVPYVLVAAGVLDGGPATTHWAFVSDFAQRFPKLQVLPDVLYVEQGQILTSAGTAAGLDCCLHLLRRRYGSEAANRVAQRLVVPPHRQGGQAQFIEQPLAVTPQGSRLSGVLDWLQAHLHQPHDLDSLAAQAHMSRRSFTRHFRQTTGSTVQHRAAPCSTVQHRAAMATGTTPRP